MKPVLPVARYRLRATFRRRAPGLLAIAVLVALLGGIAMAAIAGGRRNQSAYPEFLASTNPSDLTVPTALYQPPEFTTGYGASVLVRIARLPHVTGVESAVQLNNNPLPANGKPFHVPPNFNPITYASVDGLGIDQDRITVTRGRMVDPRRAEMVVSADGAQVLATNGIHLGATVRFGIYTNAELASSPDSANLPPPYRVVRVHFVGIGIRNDAVIHDDVDSVSASFVLFTPVVTRPFLSCCAQDTVSGLRIDGGPAAVASVEAALVRIDPRLSHVSVASTDATKIESAVEPESIAYSGFGLVAAIAAFLIAGQVVGRQLHFGADERAAMRALGAGPAMTMLDALIAVVGAIALGAVLAGIVAVSLSPLSPIGPVRRVYPTRGLAFDWTVLGGGAAVLFLGLSVLAVVLAYRNTPHRVARRARTARPRSWRVSSVVAGRLPVPMATGIRFAVEPGAGNDAVPVRSVIVGAVLAIVVVVGSLTFGSSLAALVSHPRLYGWNWNDELAGGSGVGAIPQRQSAALLRADHDVAAWSGVYFGNVQLDGVSEPVIAGASGAAVQPPLLSGHGLDATDQIVLGSVTLAQLHKHVGETVVMRAAQRPVTLRIVGTATLPAVGGEGNPHTTLGVGALISASLIPASVLNDVGNVPTGPNAIFIRLRPAADPRAALRRLGHIATELSLPTNYGVAALPVQRPAEIVNYRSARRTPSALGAGLALGAVTALALTLIASVRRRRRELALLKTLGFTRRQLAAAVAWQASVAVALGVAIGVPVGIVVGRTLWNAFAREIHAVPAPVVPALPVALVVLGALVLANIVATIPGRRAARTPTALLLRAE